MPVEEPVQQQEIDDNVDIEFNSNEKISDFETNLDSNHCTFDSDYQSIYSSSS